MARDEKDSMIHQLQFGKRSGRPAMGILLEFKGANDMDDRVQCQRMQVPDSGRLGPMS